MSPGNAWPVARLVLSACLLILAAEARAAREPSAAGIAPSSLLASALPLVLACLPLIVPRYRSLRAFSWVLLVIAFIQLYAESSR
jgi:hypothetical protein